MTTASGRRADIALPGETEYDAATQVFNLAAPARPAAATTAHTVDQVRAAIGYATERGLLVRVHSTGHGAGSARPMSDSLLIRTEMDGQVEVDPDRRTARIPAGTRWGAVIAAAAVHGLAAPHGSSPLVGAVGYLLRGGLSFYGRRIGLATNRVRAVELITGDAEPRRVDAGHDPELFWALRGGGGGFGVVTAVEIALFRAVGVVTGAAYWPVAHADQLLPAWLQWTRSAPREATTSLRVMNLPAVPEIPPALTAGPVLCVDGAVLAGADRDRPTAARAAADLLEPLRAVAQPVLDTWQPAHPPAVAAAHMDPVEPLPVYGDHMLLGDLGTAGAAEFLRMVGERSGSPLINAELRQLGGALSTPDPSGGVLDHVDADYAYLGTSVPFGTVTPEAIQEHCTAVRAALGRWDTGRTLPNFVEHHARPQRHLAPEQVRAVDRVRRRVDPNGLFRGDVAPNATGG
jgi:FAD/FMN-containing dehydrogenase